MDHERERERERERESKKNQCYELDVLISIMINVGWAFVVLHMVPFERTTFKVEQTNQSVIGNDSLR